MTIYNVFEYQGIFKLIVDNNYKTVKKEYNKNGQMLNTPSSNSELWVMVEDLVAPLLIDHLAN